MSGHSENQIAPDRMTRRTAMLSTTAMTGAFISYAAAGVTSPSFVQTHSDVPMLPIVDTNVSLFEWPFRRLPLAATSLLVERLRSLGVVEAWAGTFEGVLHRDLAAANQRLAEACAEHSVLVPIGSVNPALPGWQSDLRRCAEVHRMPGIRLHPGYHGYSLEGPEFRELLQLAVEHQLFVQVAISLEDNRTQPQLLQIADVELNGLPAAMDGLHGLRLQLLNHRFRGTLPVALREMEGLFLDTARVDGTDSVPLLLRAMPAGRVMLGSHAPFLIPEAAVIRVHESDQLSAAELQQVYSVNAQQFRSGAIA
ncbi:MAG: hypothetical protein KDA85_01645 [Planctomycetaceae bacterium]|nr:hypothetical protein [Planctomycetaceae bacterium]